MPPNSPKIPDAELAIIKAWIEKGSTGKLRQLPRLR